MRICEAIKPDGFRCKARAMEGSSWCYNHHPDHAAERKLHASKGGRRGGRGRPAKPAEGIGEIKSLLSDLTAAVLSGEVERANAIAANQLLNTSLRALELERKWKELLELEVRLEAVESTLKQRERRQSA